MKWLSLIVLWACSGSPASRAPTPAPTFTPTTFTAQVNGNGRAVILIPGLGCPASVWDETVAHLGSGYETHAITMAGFAGQPPVGSPSIASTRDELARYIRDRKLTRPIVIGHSLGGFLAYWLAEQEPDLVGPIVVVDNALFPQGAMDPTATLPEAEKQMTALRDQLLSLSPTDFAQQLRAMFTAMTAKPDKLAPVIDAVTRSDQRTIAHAIYELFTTDLRPDAARIRTPALLVLADGPFRAGAEQQAKSVAQHEVKVVPGVKHFVMNDDPPAFFAVLDEFLARHPVP